MGLPLTPWEIAITIGMCVLGTVITRFTTFLLLSRKAELPALVAFLGRVLPPAVMGFLLVDSLKDIAFSGESQWLPAGIALVVLVALHGWRRNMLLSIAAGTIVYMVMIRVMG